MSHRRARAITLQGTGIHVGVTVAAETMRPLLDGCASADDRVWDTQVHGLFESGAAGVRVLDRGRGGAGVSPAPPFRAHRALRDAAYDRLADALEAALDPRALRELGAS